MCIFYVHPLHFARQFGHISEHSHAGLGLFIISLLLLSVLFRFLSSDLNDKVVTPSTFGPAYITISRHIYLLYERGAKYKYCPLKSASLP